MGDGAARHGAPYCAARQKYNFVKRKHIYCLLFNKNSDGKLTNWSLLLIINLEKRYNRIPQKPQKIMVLNDNRGESINVMIRTPRIVIMMCGK